MGGASASMKCYQCGELGHHADACSNKVLRCYRCGKASHRVTECKNEGATYYNCGEKSHMSNVVPQNFPSHFLQDLLLHGWLQTLA